MSWTKKYYYVVDDMLMQQEGTVNIYLYLLKLIFFLVFFKKKYLFRNLHSQQCIFIYVLLNLQRIWIEIFVFI